MRPFPIFVFLTTLLRMVASAALMTFTTGASMLIDDFGAIAVDELSDVASLAELRSMLG